MSKKLNTKPLITSFTVNGTWIQNNGNTNIKGNLNADGVIIWHKGETVFMNWTRLVDTNTKEPMDQHISDPISPNRGKHTSLNYIFYLNNF